MGEIFPREVANQPEAFTGERLTTAIGGQIQIEHYHRYLFARSLVRECDVLDVASGEGYGSALLAQVARSVIGVEYAESTVHSATANFPRPNLRFLRGDARALPLADAVVDAVVSFETIEHFRRQADFVREVKRVLRPGGCFIVSTPDRDIYSPLNAPANPYHVHELSRQEFCVLLRQYFAHVALVQQRPMLGSALLAETVAAAAPLVVERRGETHFEASTGLTRAPYLVAVASDCEPPPLPPSVYIDRSDLDTDRLRVAQFAAQLEQSRAALAEAHETIAELRRHGEELGRHCDEAFAALRDTQAALQRAQADESDMRSVLAEANAKLHNAELQHLRTVDELHAAIGRAERADADLRGAEVEREGLQTRYNMLQSSSRRFLRGYLPLLCRHLLNRRG